MLTEKTVVYGDVEALAVSGQKAVQSWLNAHA
jgi:hypothetical protein